MTPRSHASSVSSIAARYSSSSRNSRGSSGGAASRARLALGQLRRDPLGPEFELRAGLLDRQAEQKREGNDELGILAARLAEHLSQPFLRRVVAGVGERVHRPVRIALLVGRLGHLDQAVALQSLDRLVQAGPRADVDDPVLALRLEQLLHPVDVHGLREQLPEDE